jgi:hypothetical protein
MELHPSLLAADAAAAELKERAAALRRLRDRLAKAGPGGLNTKPLNP